MVGEGGKRGAVWLSFPYDGVCREDGSLTRFVR